MSNAPPQQGTVCGECGSPGAVREYPPKSKKYLCSVCCEDIERIVREKRNNAMRGWRGDHRKLKR